MNIQLKNLGTVNKNFLKIDGSNGNNIKIYFSYETPVSFSARIETVENIQHYNFTRQNDWSTTTGKLLNECEPDKSKRIDGEQFMRLLEDALVNFN